MRIGGPVPARRAMAAGPLALLLAGALLGGCGLVPASGIRTMARGGGGVPALPVTVVDRAGIVVAAGPARLGDRDGPLDGIGAIPGRDDAVEVSWVGGSCDERATLIVTADGEGFVVAVETQVLTSACDLAGHVRIVELVLNRPVGADAFELVPAGG